MKYNFVQTEWVVIEEFPRYEINSLGIIRTRGDHTQIATQVSHIETVKLVKNKQRYMRSVRKLTKIAFPQLYP
jgi:hypothetical protein